MTFSILIGNTQASTHVTIYEAVMFSGYSEQYIRRLVRDGRIKGLKIARTWLIELASLREFLTEAQRTQESDARHGPHRAVRNNSHRDEKS